MPFIWTPRTRDRQPHYASARANHKFGLQHLWWARGAVADIGGAALIDATGRAHGVIGSGTAGNPSGTRFGRSDNTGPDLVFDNTGTGTITSTRIYLGDASGSGAPKSDKLTFFLRIMVPLYGGGQIYGGGNGSNGTASLRIYPDKFQFLSQGVAVIAETTPTINDGVWRNVALTYDGTVGTFYINGQAAGSGSNAQTFSHTVQHCIGEGYGGAELIGGGVRLKYLAIMPRVASPAEIKEIAENWLRLFEPERTPVFYSISGVSPGPSTANRIMLLRRPGLSRIWR